MIINLSARDFSYYFNKGLVSLNLVIIIATSNNNYCSALGSPKESLYPLSK